MQIIDFARKGNVVRFYLGHRELESWHGDDWDDTPYEHNAGQVYDEFVCGTRDIAFPFDSAVLEPCCGHMNSNWSKEDMVARRVPCIIVVPPHLLAEASWKDDDFDYWVGAAGVQRYYFGDAMEDD